MKVRKGNEEVRGRYGMGDKKWKVWRKDKEMEGCAGGKTTSNLKGWL